MRLVLTLAFLSVALGLRCVYNQDGSDYDVSYSEPSGNAYCIRAGSACLQENLGCSADDVAKKVVKKVAFGTTDPSLCDSYKKEPITREIHCCKTDNCNALPGRRIVNYETLPKK